jgi:hypothetical protein
VHGSAGLRPFSLLAAVRAGGKKPQFKAILPAFTTMSNERGKQWPAPDGWENEWMLAPCLLACKRTNRTDKNNLGP